MPVSASNAPSCRQQSKFKTEFQCYHMGPPELRPVLLKTVDCFVVDRNGNPIMRKRRKRERVQRQRTMRYFYEVARLANRWCFVEWDQGGHVVEMKITRTLKEATALYEGEPGTVTLLDVP